MFDLEHAAHQMAYLEGIGAFTMLQKLPQRGDQVTPERVRRVAEKYLQPHQRTIGWYLADSSKKSLTEHNIACIPGCGQDRCGSSARF